MKCLRYILVIICGGLLTLSLLLPSGDLAGRPPRTNHEETIFQGVVYRRQARLEPRPLMIHLLEIDLTTPGISFLVTPPDPASSRETSALTTSAFLKKFKVQAAINGSFFKPYYSRSPWDYYPRRGDPVNVIGLAISNGLVYSPDQPRVARLCITGQSLTLAADSCPLDTRQALAGDCLIIQSGRMPPRYRGGDLHPRSALALDQAGQTLWLVVVDGRQPGYSEGVTIEELANILLEQGAYTALNLDGGGSSTLVIDRAGQAQVLNAPTHPRLAGRERPVANHLGLYARETRY